MYQLTTTHAILRLSDGAFIPADPANTDYAAYQKWLWDGNTPEPAPIPVPQVPQVVTRFQARAALHLAGLLPAVEAIMQNPDTPVLAQLAWDDALSFVRTSPTILTLAGVLGLDDAALDQLFITASGIEA